MIRATLIALSLAALSGCARPPVTGADAGLLPGLGAGPATLAADPASPAFFRTQIGDRVLFAVDQSTLDDGARVVLAGQARWLNSNPEYAVLVEGHADEQGTREYNLALGARRANAVQEYLVSQGLAPGRLSTVSFGKERPAEVCSEEACYARNRRAVTVLAAGAGV